MLCEKCHARDAAVQITKIVNGRRQRINLCEQCAAEESMEDLLGLSEMFSRLMRRGRGDQLYDLFSESAQKVIYLAREETKRLGQPHLDTQHLLLALIKEEGIAAKILEGLGINLVDLFSEVEAMTGRGEVIHRSLQDIILTPKAKKVLELAYSAAGELGFPYVGSEHILLGLIREGEGIAAQALVGKGLTYEKVNKKILEMLDHQRPEPGEGPGGPPKNVLEFFGRDLTQLARENKLDPVVGRQPEINRVIRVLSRRTKNNPVLVGDPGVGKTAIVEGIAQAIVKGDVPEAIKDKKIYALDLGGIVAGTRYRGEFEERMKKVLQEINKQSGQIIVFIDELHTLIGAGAAEGAIDAANILKPALARGELHCIGATTLEEFRKYIEKDAALERRFQPVMVREPTVEETEKILQGLRDRYEAHHRVIIPDEVIAAAVQLSKRYISDRFLPDKAVDVMDEAAAKVRLHTISTPPELKDLEKELALVNKEKEAAIKEQKFEKAAKLRDRISELEGEIKKADDLWRRERGKETPVVTTKDIAEVVSDWTGIPVVELTQEESARLLKMEEELGRKVIGQDEAISVLSQAIRRARSGLKDPRRPVGSFIFAGPTGVGKSELAKALAEFLFGSVDRLIRLDMSEYGEKHTTSRLIGAPPGYVGYDEGGQLTEQVRRQPYSVILLDEMEKAHPEVFNVLLQVMEDGRLTDGQGRVVDFRNAVLIMTSNIGTGGRELGFETPKGKDRSGYDRMRDRVQEEIRKTLRPEFINRVDETVVFRQLTRDDLLKIVDLLLANVLSQVLAKDMKLVVGQKVKEFLAEKGYNETYGARDLRRVIQRYIENPLANEMLTGRFSKGQAIETRLDGAEIRFGAKSKIGSGGKRP